MFELLPEEEASVAGLVEDERRIAVFAADRGRLDRLKAIAEHLPAATIAITIDLEREGMPEFFGSDVVLIDAGDDPLIPGDPILEHLGRLDILAAQRGVPVIANAGPDRLDAVAACLAISNVTLLCQAEEYDWAAATALLQDSSSHVREASAEESLRLQRISEEVERVARMLSELAGQRRGNYAGYREAAPTLRAPPDTYRSGPTPPVTADDVRGIVRLRRMRERYFPADLFADPAWDMLLDLMVARIEKSAIAVSSLCIAAAVPPTTALRWIKTMTDNGMFVRVSDPDDGRRIFIELSENTAQAMMAYLGAAKAQGGLAI